MSDSDFSPAPSLLATIWKGLDGPADLPAQVTFTGAGALPSVFAVTDLAAASTAAAGLAVAEFIAARHDTLPRLTTDRRLASFWFNRTIRAEGWKLPPQWDAVAGDYATADGWIRLHTNAPHHRAAALRVLGVPEDREAVARAVAKWQAEALETVVVEAGGVAAQMRSIEAWAAHPQGRAVTAEPLLHRAAATEGAAPQWRGTPARPLAGIRVLDCTRILAGPVGTRFLAGFGADVLRIDPVDWDEPTLAPEVTLGKRCAKLDLRTPEGRATFEDLLREADAFVHGYRSDALIKLGYGPEERQRLCPGLVDVSLDAYGHTGPWRARRGFDSLVQMSSGIADAGMRLWNRDKPTPLPVQALDYATGYLLAASVVRGLTARAREGMGSVTRASLARTAALLIETPAPAQGDLAPEADADYGKDIENTAWGAARRMLPPVAIAGAPMHWDRPAGNLGSAQPAW